MALNKVKLEQDILAALNKGVTTEPDPGAGVDGAVKSKYSESDVAGFIADAIVDYASAAQIMAIPGPYLFPNLIPPHSPPLLPDLQVHLLPFKCPNAPFGKSALKGSIEASFAAQDRSMAAISAGIIAYLSTLTLWQSPQKNTATGLCIPGAPPIFTFDDPPKRSPEACAKMMASAIHSTFTTSTVQGVVFTILLGVGPMIGSPLF